MTEKIRVSYIGDSPFIFSGFGVVAKAIMSRLDPEIFEIFCQGTMYQHYPKNLDEIPAMEYYMPSCIHDLMGFKASIDFIQHSDPDVLFLVADPGTMRSRFSTMNLTGRMGKIPIVTYFPIEGAPLNPHIIEQAAISYRPVTYTRWGRDLVNAELEARPDTEPDVDWTWHGADHAPFFAYDQSVRKRLRQMVGWDDRFVVGMVGMNKRTNRQPVYIETASILKASGRDDVLFYLHCQASGEMMMQGWELPWLIGSFGVKDQIQLKPNQAEHKYIGRPRKREGMLSILDRPLPETEEEAQKNLAEMDFIALLNMFDLYLDLASGHGFNLPAAEAARCGVPLITVNDNFARTEIYGDVAVMLEPSSSDFWHTGAVLPLVSPQRAADAIMELWDDSEKRAAVRAACKEKFDSVTWQPVADLFAHKIIEAHEYGVEMFGN